MRRKLGDGGVVTANNLGIACRECECASARALNEEAWRARGTESVGSHSLEDGASGSCSR